MKYRTIENPAQVRLRRERRAAMQENEFPLEDLNGNTIIKVVELLKKVELSA